MLAIGTYVLGYLASTAFPPPHAQQLVGLTIWRPGIRAPTGVLVPVSDHDKEAGTGMHEDGAKRPLLAPHGDGYRGGQPAKGTIQ